MRNKSLEILNIRWCRWHFILRSGCIVFTMFVACITHFTDLYFPKKWAYAHPNNLKVIFLNFSSLTPSTYLWSIAYIVLKLCMTITGYISSMIKRRTKPTLWLKASFSFFTNCRKIVQAYTSTLDRSIDERDFLLI